MLSLLFVVAVEAREIVRETRAELPPEAWYVFQGRPKCGVVVIVGADGVPDGAVAEHCPPALADVGERAALRWRWAPSSQLSTEEVTVRFPKSARLPRRWDGERCLHAFRTTDAGDVVELDPARHGRCEVVAKGAVVPDDFPLDVRTRAWCAVDVTVGPDGVRGASVAWCPSAIADEAAATARGFAYRAPEEAAYRVLIAYDPPA